MLRLQLSRKLNIWRESLYRSSVWQALCHDGVIKWKHFPRYWPFAWGNPRSRVNSPLKGQWSGAFVFSLICAWINGWVKDCKAGDLRRHRAHYGVIVMWGWPADFPHEGQKCGNHFHVMMASCLLHFTHWGRMTHICVGNLTIIGSDNGLSPGRRQAITWTNVGILLIGPQGTNFS